MLDKKRDVRAKFCDIIFRAAIRRYMESIVLLLVPLFLTDHGSEEVKMNVEPWKETVFLWRDGNESKYSIKNTYEEENDCRLLIQNIEGFIGFRADEKFIPVFIDGAVESITGYSKEDFLSCRIKWLEMAIAEDRSLIFESIKKAISNPTVSIEFEYRIRNRDGETKWVSQVIQKTPEDSGKPGKIQGFIRDITRYKLAENSLEKIENVRIKEINHRVKNNLQVISSLLSLEAERFTDPDTLEAFRESQNRIASMSLIHQELYTGETDTIDFSDYLRKLTSGLFSSYRVGKDEINLKLDLEQIYIETDTAVALGIIVNELVSNALKYAFPAGKEGKIHIRLSRVKDCEKGHKNSGDSGTALDCSDRKDFPFILTVEDNGQGIPEWVDLRNTDSLGLQLVNIFVDQIEGSIELKRENGTKFDIRFNKLEK